MFNIISFLILQESMILLKCEYAEQDNNNINLFKYKYKCSLFEVSCIRKAKWPIYEEI